MKLIKLLPWIAAVGVAWTGGFIYNVYVGGELSWLRELYEQKIAIAAATPEDQPRLLVLGGSGAHYTINSEVLEQGLGIPVINLGLDGPVGLDVILASMIEQIRPGDTVLLIPEYLILLDPDGIGDRSATFGVAIGQPGLGGVGIQEIVERGWLLGVPSLRALTKSTTDLLTEGELTGYYSDPITERGDPTVVKERVGDWWELPIRQPISRHAWESIRQFKAEVEARGGTLILSLPWVYADPDVSLPNVKKTAQALEAIAPTIYNPRTYNLKSDPDLFSDTHYHLQPEAQVLRSQQLIEQLKPLLSSSSYEQ